MLLPHRPADVLRADGEGRLLRRQHGRRRGTVRLPMNGLPMNGIDGKPAVLFLCVHNAGRGQMALGFFRHLAGDRAVAWSGGSEPGEQVNPSAVAAMREVGIDITGEFPTPWTDEVVRAADVVVTMGCGDACWWPSMVRRWRLNW